MDEKGVIVEEYFNSKRLASMRSQSEDQVLLGVDDSACTTSQFVKDKEPKSSSTAPSSPRCSDAALFSKNTSIERDISSPPSSPPTALPASPSRNRKPTFSFLKRKRSTRNRDSSNVAHMPLTDTSENVLKDPRTTKKRRLTQMQIDLGGEVRKTCNQCGMEYIPSNQQDTALHSRFHIENIDGVEIGKTFIKDKSLTWLQPSIGALKPDEDIVVVESRSSGKARKQANKVLEIVNADLSAPPIDNKHLWGDLEPSLLEPEDTKLKKRKIKNEGSEVRSERFKVFMYLVKGHCVGFCLAEKISTAFQVVDHHTDDNTQKLLSSALSISSSISMSSKADVALLGISRIWTSKSYRNQNIATNLLDCARAMFFYGLELPKNLVAFSQPTDSGGQLAKRWFGAKTGWHVYTEQAASLRLEE